MTAGDAQRLATPVACALALLQSVDAPSYVARDLVVALDRYARQQATNGLGVPPELADLQHVFVAAAQIRSSGTVTDRHASSFLAGTQATVDAEPVTSASLISAAQATARAGCSRSTLDRRVKAGELTPVRHGRIVRYRAGDVDALFGGTEC